MPLAVEIRKLTKDFSSGLDAGRVRAVDDLTLEIPEGSVHALAGPNGSGKSTTIKALLGLVAPTLGTCRIFGIDPAHSKARTKVGYLPDAPEFYRHVTGRELVRFYARICGMDRAGCGAAVNRAVKLVEMDAAADRPVGTYSKGMLQRIGLAQALVHEPRLVVLDEPFAGLDFAGSAMLSSLISRLKEEGKTVLFSTHLLPALETRCDTITLLDRGRALFSGPVGELLAHDSRRAIVADALSPQETEELTAWLRERGCAAELTAILPQGLEGVFRRLQSGTKGREAGR